MRHFARGKQGIARPQLDSLGPNLKDELTFNAVEPFVLVVMQMTCRPSFAVESVLQCQKVVPAADLEIDTTYAKPPVLTKPVPTGLYDQGGYGAFRRL